MADRAWTPPADLMGWIRSSSCFFSFFQLVRLLEKNLGGARLAEGKPEEERIRLRPDPSLLFPRSDITRVDIEEIQERKRVVVWTTFLGLYGTCSPLPTAYLEEFTDDEEDGVLYRDFLDIFNHRILSLLYLSWRRCQFTAAYDPRKPDDISSMVLALAGFEPDWIRNLEGLDAEWLLYWSGLLCRRPCSATALEAILARTVHPTVSIEQCVARWVEIQPERRVRLSVQHARLGRNQTIGRSVRDRVGKFRVWIGPLPHERLKDFLPGGVKHRRLHSVIKLVVGNSMDYDVCVVVAPGNCKGMRLSAAGDTRLHVNSWAGRPKRRYLHFTIQGTTTGPGAIRVEQSDNVGGCEHLEQTVARSEG